MKLLSSIRAVAMSLAIGASLPRVLTGQPESVVQQLPGVYLQVFVEPLGPSGTVVTASELLNESVPLVIRFRLMTRVLRPGQCHVPVGYAPTYELPLYELTYRISVGGQEFFVDRVDLFGRNGPGVLEVKPGITVPAASKIRIVAKLEYQRGIFAPCSVAGYIDAVSEATQERNVRVDLVRRRYLRYRDGYVRRHLIDLGRGTSWVWLKEYEAGVDRRELLYHSRLFVTLDGRTRVYIPWVYDCPAPADANGDGRYDSDGDGFLDENPCGTSIATHSVALHGEGENPLLRGGLAMATFSLEYLVTRDVNSLNHALEVLAFVERSEWIKPDGTRSGFFLRSDYPGHVDGPSGREFFAASIDEISGMTLGLFYLRQALEASGQVANLQRLVRLVDRLATKLANDHYFIIPPDGLPQERQRGWAGAYPFEFFLAFGFSTITGKTYDTPHLGGPLIFQDPFWQHVRQMPFKGRDADDLRMVEAGLVLDMSQMERAQTSIQAAGFLMFHHGSDFTVPIECFGHVFDRKTISIPDDAFPRWDFPMLLHVFQLISRYTESPIYQRLSPAKKMGMPFSERGVFELRILGLKREMRKVIMGVVRGGSSTKINILDVGGGFLRELAEPILAGGITEHVCDFEIDVPVGTRTPEDDYYAAAVALANDLPETHPTPDRRPGITADLFAVINRVQNQFAPGLPVGERQGVGGNTHNPAGKLGTDFMWEKTPESGDRVEGGGTEPGAGVFDRDIAALSSRGYDAMREGGGLDYLLPSVLLRVFEDHSAPPRVDEPMSPRLGACFTLPRTLEQRQRLRGSWMPNDDPCFFWFPKLTLDAFDSASSNSSYSKATPVALGQPVAANIDRMTHGSYSNVGYATYVAQARTHVVPPEGDYDYYSVAVSSEDQRDIEVRVAYQCLVDCRTEMRLVVDGQEAPAPFLTGCSAPPCSGSLSLVLPARPRHIVMVTGGLAYYSLAVTATPQ
jgi:hypothetical protein